MTKPPDTHGMEIECLACGARRQPAGHTRDELDVCPECGYVGWAFVGDLTDDERAQLRRRYRCEHAHDLRLVARRRVRQRPSFRPASRTGEEPKTV